MKREDSDDSDSGKLVVQMSPLDGSYSKTLLESEWEEQQHQVVYDSVFMLIHNSFVKQRSFWVKFRDLSPGPYRWNSSIDTEDVTGVIMTEPLSQDPQLDRVFWIDPSTQSIEYYYISWNPYAWLVPSWTMKQRGRLLIHPSLADAGGLDMTDSRLFWTERSSGRLWTADIETKDGSVRELPGVTGGRSLRLIQPWLRPPAEPVCGEGLSGCSHFCLRYKHSLIWRPATAGCDCPDGMHLDSDEMTCLTNT